MGSGPIITLDPVGSQALGGGISGSMLVYQTVLRDTSAIRFYNIAAHTYAWPPSQWNSGAWQWRPSISGHFVLFGRSAPYAIGFTYQAYLGDRTTGALTQLTSLTGQDASVTPGQVNGNYAVWEECQDEHVQCDVYRYDIATKTTALIANTFSSGAFQYSPSVTKAGTVYFVHSGNGCGASATLVRQPLGGSDTVLVTFKRGIEVSSTYVDDTGGTPIVYYSQSSCANRERHGDVYKIID